MPYPEGMSVEVSFSPTMQRFHVTALLRNGEDELFTSSSRHLSDALENFADQIRIKYEDSQPRCQTCKSAQRLPTFTCHDHWHYEGVAAPLEPTPLCLNTHEDADRSVIYVPTEANLPILEARRKT
jgi:hypothetical protein